MIYSNKTHNLDQPNKSLNSKQRNIKAIEPNR